ncbi:MAG: peptidylprolyl isomerase [Alphaproteobacteria bacterium]|nr:peptidylprolyl isomerase [Alphaproteobacteria bacterium]
MKKALLSLALGIALLFAYLPAYSAAQEGIAAIVNDSVITVTDVRDRATLYQSGSPQKPTPEQKNKMEQQVLSRLIDESLQLQEAKKLGIVIGDDDVAAGFADIARQNNVSPEEFKKRLAKAGVNVNSLYNQIRADISWSQVVRRKLRPQVNISEGDIDQTMDQIARNSGKAQYRVAEIFLGVAEPAKEAEVRDGAEDLVKQLKQGTPFSGLAHQFSQAPGAANGGDLGWVQEGQLDPELDTALGKMQPGQVSPPLRSAKGYHILFLMDVRHTANQQEAAGDQIVSLKQIFIPVTKKDSQSAAAAKVARAKSLKNTIKSCKAMSARMKDFPSPGTSDLGKGLLSNLPEELRPIISNLKVGELSEPLLSPLGIVLVMVCSREEAPAAAGQDGAAPEAGSAGKDEASRNKIASQIGLKRLDQMAQRYLRDLRATAFIDKRI